MGVDCVDNSGVDTMILPDGRVPSTPDFASDSTATPAAISDIVSEISDTDALIIDLRYNGGGHPDMVAFELSYPLDGASVRLIGFVDCNDTLKKLVLDND
jgi:hypothetical protein